MEKNKITETLLVLTTGFLLLYLFLKIPFFLYLALFTGIAGIFVKPLAKYIAMAWFKLGDVLGYLTSRLLLGILFFVVLFPVSVLYRLTTKDKLHVKRSPESNWTERNKDFTPGDFKNIW